MEGPVVPGLRDVGCRITVSQQPQAALKDNQSLVLPLNQCSQGLWKPWIRGRFISA
jgi:hypothetical protein